MDISVNTVWAYAERSLTAPLGRIRTELVRLLGQLKFTVKTDQLTLVEATRGAKFAGGGREESKVPAAIRLRLAGEGDTATVVIQLSDTWKFPTRRPIEVYQELFRDVIADLDGALRRIDPRAAEFAEPQYSVHPDAPPPPTTAGRMTQGANRFLDASPGPTPRGWRETGDVVILSPRAMAVLPIETAYGMVTVGTLVASKPGAMPPALVGQVEKLTGMLEQLLQQTAYQQMTAWLQIEESASAVVEFLVQQSRIREEVALRTLQICVTCRLAKVVNPDYTKLRNRRNRVNVLSGSLGAVISPVGISPFVLIGRLAQLNQLDPEFVCPRCQGLHAESSLITFCPRCGQQCDDSALRACAKCQFDFRSLARTRDLWQDPPAANGGNPAAVGSASNAIPAAEPAVELAKPDLPQDWPDATRAHPVPAAPAASSAQHGETPPTQVERDAPEPTFNNWPPPQPEAAPQQFSGQDFPPPSTTVDAVPQQVGSFAGSSSSQWAAPSAESAVGWGDDGAAFQGWYPDPQGRFDARWWDGFAWTEHVSTAGAVTVDPI